MAADNVSVSLGLEVTQKASTSSLCQRWIDLLRDLELVLLMLTVAPAGTGFGCVGFPMESEAFVTCKW